MLQAEQETFWVILYWNRKQCFDSPGSPLLTVIAGQILDFISSTGFCRPRFIYHLCSIATCNAVIAIYGDSLLSLIFSSLCSFWGKLHNMMPRETSSYLFVSVCSIANVRGQKANKQKRPSNVWNSSWSSRSICSFCFPPQSLLSFVHVCMPSHLCLILQLRELHIHSRLSFDFTSKIHFELWLSTTAIIRLSRACEDYKLSNSCQQSVER